MLQIGIKKGSSLVEFLVATSIASVLLVSVSMQFVTISATFHDLSIIRRTELEAENVLNIIGFDLRMMGTGIPFQQDDFEINDIGLSDISTSSPIDISTASATNISFKMDEDGDTYVLTSAFDPSISYSFTLDNVADLNVGDTVYLSNGPMTGQQGLKGTISAISGTTVTLSNTYTTSVDSTFEQGKIYFEAGSTLNEVSTVTFTSNANYGGITRSSPNSTVTLAKNAEFSLDYLADDGTAITLPLSYDELNNEAGNDLNMIKVTVKIKSERKLKHLKNKTTNYIGEVSQRFSVRNLNLIDF